MEVLSIALKEKDLLISKYQKRHLNDDDDY